MSGENIKSFENSRRLITLEGVSKTFRDRQVLANIDLTVHAGQIVTVIGPNGAGKSTLLRIAIGLMKPDSGSVYRAEGLKIGYVPQRLHVDDILPLTVRRFMSLHPRVEEGAIDAILEETKTRHLAGHPIQRISGGEMQRVLMARALIGSPDLLVLDEPVQGVDVTGQGELYKLIDTIRGRFGCGVLMVSHDLHLVMAATDKVVCLNQHICCSGTPGMVGQDPNFLALFGAAAGSFALYAHVHDHKHDLHGDVLVDKGPCNHD